jgi:type II secretory pathway predicted ATPase ExeA
VNNKMLALYGLKWNPFAPNVPTEALHVTRAWNPSAGASQQLAGEGGFALVTGAPGCGKSAALRILSASLADTARRHGRRDQPAAGQHRRLLSRDGRTLRRRVAPA